MPTIRRPYPDLSGIASLDLTGTVHRCPGADCIACERGSRPDPGISGGRAWFWWTTRPGSQDNPHTPVATGDDPARWTPDRGRKLHAFRRNLAASPSPNSPEWLAGLRGAMGRAFARRLATHVRGRGFPPRRGTV